MNAIGIDKIQMVDLKGQYARIKPAIDAAIQECIDTTAFIKGPQVARFENALAEYLNVAHVVSCANGTDALQIALMALNLRPGDEVIVPAFTYVATAEVIGLLGLTPVMIDVDPQTYNINRHLVEAAITDKTKLVVPVHLFGQCADMEGILDVCAPLGIAVVEDAAQAIGAKYLFRNGKTRSAGAIGAIGTTSFFPSKNLGCFGDGGAVYTNDAALARQTKMIANHGQDRKYIHDAIGINSRLDTLQAAVLLEKLPQLDTYIAARQSAAEYYDAALSEVDDIEIPYRAPYSTHVYHQYTLKVPVGVRDDVKAYLQSQGIPSMVYYPLPLNHQKAYANLGRVDGELKVTRDLCQRVLSLPMHTELTEEQLAYITDTIKAYFAR